MKRFSLNHLWMPVLLVCLLLLNIHIIVDGADADVIFKDHMTFRETLVVATGMGWTDYLRLSPRVRNHLLMEKKCRPAFREWKERAGQEGTNLKFRLKKWELQLHEWLSEKLD